MQHIGEYTVVGIAQEPDHGVLNELVRFVIARLDDDHDQLKRATRAGEFGVWSERRRRIEIDTRREIVGVVQRMAVLRDLPAEVPVRACAAQLLRALADVWAEHPHYRASWRTIELPPKDAVGRSDVLDPV